MNTSLPRILGALLDPLALATILGSLAMLYVFWRFIVDDTDLRTPRGAPGDEETHTESVTDAAPGSDRTRAGAAPGRPRRS